MKEIEQDAEISVVGILKFIKSYKYIFIAFPMFATLAAFVDVQFLISPKWEASAVLQVGQAAQIGSPGQAAGDGRVIEPSLNVISRMMQPAFKDATLKDGLQSNEIVELRDIFHGSFIVRKSKEADLIELKVRAPSPESARKLAEVSVRYVQKIHNALIESSVMRINGQLQAVVADIKSVTFEIDYLKRRLEGSHNWDSYNAVLSATILSTKESERRALVQKRLLLEEELSPAMTFNTRLLGDISVSDGPVSPRKSLVMGIGFLLGLFGAVIFAWVRNANNVV